MAPSGTRVLSLAAAVLTALAAAAQGPPPPLPPEVGNAVLLATNSIQVGRDTVVVSGDLVVNDASPGPILGELELSLDQGVSTPAGFALEANGVDIDSGATIGGDVRYNVLRNGGTIDGALVTPLALPVIGMLPQIPNRPPGTNDITVPDGATQIIGTGGGIGAFGHLDIGRGATVRLPGGLYAFASITMQRAATIRWEGPGDIVIRDRLTLGAETTIGVAPGITTKRRMFFVGGANGTDGLLLSTPPSVSIGRDSNIAATIFAPNGTIDAGESMTLLGSLVARDVRVGRGSTLELRSGFRNLPPVAISGNWEVSGTDPAAITLNGFDPDNDPLLFSIVVPPARGTLSPITPAGPTSAVVVYTPSLADPNDAFVFRVTDSEGFTANGVVTINDGTPPPPPTTVTAEDALVEVPQNRLSLVTLVAIAPPGVAVTLSIVPGTGPSHGTLGPLMQPALMPQRSGTVVYIPAPDYAGPDSFVFRACGTIAGNQVCDNGTITLDVIATPNEEEDLAPDIALTAASNTLTSINLSPTPELPEEEPEEGEGDGLRSRMAANATFLRPADVAGSVADADGDGFGDSHQPLPGAGPELMAAGVGQTGGAGENGTTRIHFEWEIASLSDLVDEIRSATVLLRTNRGVDDSLDTDIHLVASGDGALTDDDFERDAEPLRQLVMPVPASQPVGADGLFSFDVADALRDALRLGFTHFSLQGRVQEGELEGPGSGLHVYTSAGGNGPMAPQLGITTGVAPARTYRVLTLPANGILRDSNGTGVTAVPYTLPSSVVFYRSASGFVGQNTFEYEVTEGTTTHTGTVTITVIAGDCSVDPAFCEGGRD